MHEPFQLAALGFLSCGVSVSASAQKYIPRKITFSGTTANQAELLAVSRLNAGDALDQAGIQASTSMKIRTSWTWW